MNPASRAATFEMEMDRKSSEREGMLKRANSIKASKTCTELVAS